MPRWLERLTTLRVESGKEFTAVKRHRIALRILEFMRSRQSVFWNFAIAQFYPRAACVIRPQKLPVRVMQ
jgi:hypothetical protein